MKRLFFAIATLLIAALACNLPGAQNQAVDATITAAAATFEAELTNLAQTQAVAPRTPTSPSQPTVVTATLPPSITPLPPTLTPLPCNLAAFVKDVTYPDGAEVTVGQAYTKTWRFKNIGTCAWTSGYQLVFDHGDQMSGPVAQALTGSVVAPGATVDISVNLVAPAARGTYRGYWRMRDTGAVLFGLGAGAFWVEIKAVDAATATPTQTLTPTTTLTPTATSTPTVTLPPS